MDILEAMPGNAPMLPSNIKKPYFSASLQVSPGITATDRPQKVSKDKYEELHLPDLHLGSLVSDIVNFTLDPSN